MLGIPVWAWIIVLLAAIGLATLHYYKILRNRGSQIWWVAFALRAIGYCGVLLLLFNPWWQLQEEKVETPVLLVYEDRSASVDSASLEKWRSMSTEIASMKKMRIQRFGLSLIHI
jgi:drug/metabolite transporter (DMT)-like permease